MLHSRRDEYLLKCVGENRFIHLFAGSGNNLLPEDEANGYVDYVYWHVYEAGLIPPMYVPGFVDLEEDGCSYQPKNYEDTPIEEIIECVESFEGEVEIVDKLR